MKQTKRDRLSDISSDSLYSGIRDIKLSQQESSSNEAKGGSSSNMGG